MARCRPTTNTRRNATAICWRTAATLTVRGEWLSYYFPPFNILKGDNAIVCYGSKQYEAAWFALIEIKQWK